MVFPSYRKTDSLTDTASFNVNSFFAICFEKNLIYAISII